MTPLAMQDLKPQRSVEPESSWHLVGAQCDRADPLNHGQPCCFISPAVSRTIVFGECRDHAASSIFKDEESSVPGSLATFRQR